LSLDRILSVLWRSCSGNVNNKFLITSHPALPIFKYMNDNLISLLTWSSPAILQEWDHCIRYWRMFSRALELKSISWGAGIDIESGRRFMILITICWWSNRNLNTLWCLLWASKFENLKSMLISMCMWVKRKNTVYVYLQYPYAKIECIR